MDKEKILIVNGDKYVRQKLAECLNEQYTVCTSGSFKEALKVYKDEKFYTVLTEIHTGEAQGIEMISKLQEVKSDIPIIVVTTHDSVPLAVEAMKAGAYDYITKPFNFDELKLVVLHALERKKLQEEASQKRIYQELALVDGLTQIYNRRYFDEVLRGESERARRYPQQFSLLMVDIDDFKRYNDAFGHPAGDEALKKIARLLLKKSRATDFVARYGGEEFAVITPHSGKKSASVLGIRLVGLVNKEKFPAGATDAAVTISVGIASFNEDTADKEELVKMADNALYQAKKLGKNRVCLFGSHPDTGGISGA